MVDFTKNKTWAATQVIEDNSDTQITPTLGNTLLHSGNTSLVTFGGAAPDGSTEALNLGRANSGFVETARPSVTVANHHVFFNGNGQVGSVSTAGTTTSYNVSSDPRLKDFKGQPVDDDIDSEFNKLFICFDTFNWKNDPSGQLVWGFNAHGCIDAGLDMGTEGQGSRELNLGDVYNTIPAVIEPQEVQVLYKTGEKKGEPRFNADGSLMMETVDVVVTPEIEEKVSPAGVDQAKAVPILLAKIEQQGRYMTALQIGLNDALNRLTAAGL